MAGGLQPGDPRQIGPYRLVGQLGSGGMGRVFLGLSAGGRPVAVKVVRPELAADQEFRVRFGREVAAARRVSGLFTALVVDADVDGPVPWLATAYVAGPSLSAAVARQGLMPARAVLALAAGLAEGLSAIHAAGVVHCDLKPSNVLLSPDGPRVIDFGISRAAGTAPAITGVGMVIGSPGFMSPEQALGQEIGPPSDIFSLGAVLTFAATGGGPFGQGSSPELAYRLVYAPPSLGSLPAGLRPLVERCLAKDPGERPTAGEVLAAACAVQSPPGWLPDPAVSVFAPYVPPDPVAVTAAPGRRRRALGRPLAAAGTTAGVLAAAVVAGLAMSGPPRHLPAPQAAPRAAVAPARTGVPSVTPGTHPAPSRSSSSGASARPDIIPAAVTVTSPGVRSSPSATPSPARPPASPSPTASPYPAPSPSASPPPPAPQIMSVGTYQQGTWVYLEIQYADPGHDAQGFGFAGADGSRWIEDSYPFPGPGIGIIGPDSIAYPLDLACGTPRQHDADIEAWIYGTAGARSQPGEIHLACTSPAGTLAAGQGAEHAQESIGIG